MMRLAMYRFDGRWTAPGALAVTALLAGCAAPAHRTAEGPDLVQSPRHVETMGETVAREMSEGGCMVAGNRSEGGCERDLEALGEVLAPPVLPPPPSPSAGG